MTIARTPEYLALLINELRALPQETEWVEFKGNNANPDDIGQYVSALSNASVLADKSFGYLVWGIANDTHEVIGTTFSYEMKAAGNEQLENWLLRLLTPRVSFRFHEVMMDDNKVVLLEVARAIDRPVSFKGVEFIRIGSYKKRLSEHPEKERALWRAFDQAAFEDGIACDQLAAADVLQLLDYPSYYVLLERPQPTTPDSILSNLQADGLVTKDAAGLWCITNLGAILFAKRLEDFQSVQRKSMRVIRYKGNSRISTAWEHVASKGYASGFEDLISFVSGHLPPNEEIGKALRRTVPVYPDLAVRELVANALIHQEFSVPGAGPMIEIFDDRLEISNPGRSLIPPDRFLDSPPQSRNEDLASLMRRIGICEERGSGIDKVVSLTEMYQLPAPSIEDAGNSTRVTLFSRQPFNSMSREDRIRACYFHSCLKHVSQEFMTNTTLRERFGIDQKNSATVSRVIKDALDARRIKPYDESASKRYMRYVPFWA